MNIKGVFGEVPDRNSKQVVGHWKIANPHYKVAENLAKLFSTIGRKVKLVSDELT